MNESTPQHPDVDELIAVQTPDALRRRIESSGVQFISALLCLLDRITLELSAFRPVQTAFHDSPQHRQEQLQRIAITAQCARWMIKLPPAHEKFNDLYDVLVKLVADVYQKDVRNALAGWQVRLRDEIEFDRLSPPKEALPLGIAVVEPWKRTLPPKTLNGISMADHEQFWQCACELSRMGYFKRAKLVCAYQQRNGIEESSDIMSEETRRLVERCKKWLTALSTAWPGSPKPILRRGKKPQDTESIVNPQWVEENPRLT